MLHEEGKTESVKHGAHAVGGPRNKKEPKLFRAKGGKERSKGIELRRCLLT